MRIYVCYACVCSPPYGRCLSAPRLGSAAFATVQFRVNRTVDRVVTPKAKHLKKFIRTKKAKSRIETRNITFELSGYSLRATVRLN